MCDHSKPGSQKPLVTDSYILERTLGTSRNHLPLQTHTLAALRPYNHAQNNQELKRWGNLMTRQY